MEQNNKDYSDEENNDDGVIMVDLEVMVGTVMVGTVMAVVVMGM